MANPVIRNRILDLLAGGDFTVTALADSLAVPYNSAAKAIARGMEEGQVHVCGYGAHRAAIYRLGTGIDAVRLALPDPVAPAESRYEHSPLIAKERGMVEQAVEYFEMSDLLPGVKHFTCDRYKATLSVESCADKFRLANIGDAFGRHVSCKKCATGALHAGAGPDLNLGTLKGSLTCSRCHRQNGRLIGKRLCISCQNRQYEYLRKSNGKGTFPKQHPPLFKLTLGYMAGGKVSTRTALAADMTELVVDALRDSEHAPRFGWLADPATRALRDIPDLDFSILDDVDETAPVAVVLDDVDSEQDVREQAALPIVASPLADVAVPVSAELDVDPMKALRDTVEQIERDAQVSAPTRSRRAMKKIRQQAPRQVRMSNVTAQLMRAVGALPLSAPVVAPSLETAFYSAALFSS